MNNRLLTVAALGALTLTAACQGDFTIPDLNNPGLEQLEGNATITNCEFKDVLGSFGRPGSSRFHLGTLGREALTFDNSDPRYFDEMLAGILNPGNGAFGGSGWGPRYTNIRNANIVLNSLENVDGHQP